MKDTSITNRYIRLLSIAGSDSGGGAGIQADLKTFSALGCFGMTAITALTAQSTMGVRSIHSVPPEMLRDQIDAVIEDIGVDAIKIGMLHAPDIVSVVQQALVLHAPRWVVLDPVMVATSGAVLIENATVGAMVSQLFPLATIITPNLDEAALLVGRPLQTREDMTLAAQTLLDMGAQAVLVKGGHLSGDVVADVLQSRGAAPLWFEGPRIATRNTHGTGCTLSSAIAAHLAMGHTLQDAVAQARDYIRTALQGGANVITGKGSGPLNHSSAPHTMRLARQTDN